MRVLVAVPTFDEADNIVELLERLGQHAGDADVLVVDDGSADGTADLVRGIAAREAESGSPSRSIPRSIGS